MTCIAELDDIVIFFLKNYFTLDFFLLCGLFQTGSVRGGVTTSKSITVV